MNNLQQAIQDAKKYCREGVVFICRWPGIPQDPFLNVQQRILKQYKLHDVIAYYIVQLASEEVKNECRKKNERA